MLNALKSAATLGRSAPALRTATPTLPLARKASTTSTKTASALLAKLNRLNPGAPAALKLEERIAKKSLVHMTLSRPFPWQGTSLLRSLTTHLHPSNTASNVLVVGPGEQPLYEDKALGLKVRPSHVGEILAMLQFRHDGQVRAQEPHTQSQPYTPDVVVLDINPDMLPGPFLPGLHPMVHRLSEDDAPDYPELESVLNALRHGFPQTDVPLNSGALDPELLELLPQLAHNLVAPNPQLGAIRLNPFHGDITRTRLPREGIDVAVIKNVLEYALLNLRIINTTHNRFLDDRSRFTEELLGALSENGSLVLDGFSLRNLLQTSSTSLQGDVDATAAFRDDITWDGRSESSARQVYDRLNSLAEEAREQFEELGFRCTVTPEHNLALPSDITYTITMQGPTAPPVIHLGGAVQPGYVPSIEYISTPDATHAPDEPPSPSLRDDIVAQTEAETGRKISRTTAYNFSQFGSLWQLSFPVPLSRTAYMRSILNYNFGPSPDVLILGPGKTDLHEGAPRSGIQLPPSSTEPYEVAAMLMHGATGSPPGQVVIVDVDPAIEGPSSSALPDRVLKLNLPSSLGPQTIEYYGPVVEALHRELDATAEQIDRGSLRSELSQFDGVDTALHRPSDGLSSIDWQPLQANIKDLRLPQESMNLIMGRNTLYYVVLDMLAASPATFKKDKDAFLHNLVHALKPGGIILIDIISLWALNLGDQSGFKANMDILNEAYGIINENGSPRITNARFQQNFGRVKDKTGELASRLGSAKLDLSFGHAINPSSPDDIAILIRRDA